MKTLSIPFPPALNHYWRNIGKGRTILSQAAREYRTNVVAEVLSQGRSDAMTGPIAVEIVAMPPDRRRRDLDNLLKGALDALAHAGVYGDDSQIKDLRIRWGDRVGGGRLDVVLRPLTS